MPANVNTPPTGPSTAPAVPPLWRGLWNAYARFYDAIAGLAPYQEMLDEVVAALRLTPGLRVLDAGCGTGALAERLAATGTEVDYVGVDLSPAMLARARGRCPWPPGFTFIERDVDVLLAEEVRRFDRIASVNVIWTLPDPGATFARMTEALRPGGHMVHTTPRLGFRPHVVVWRHLRRQRGRARWRALALLPWLMLGGLLNLLLVAHSALRATGHRARDRWDAAALTALLQEANAVPRPVRPCYADQGLLLVAERRASETEHVPAPTR